MWSYRTHRSLAALTVVYAGYGAHILCAAVNNGLSCVAVTRGFLSKKHVQQDASRQVSRFESIMPVNVDKKIHSSIDRRCSVGRPNRDHLCLPTSDWNGVISK